MIEPLDLSGENKNNENKTDNDQSVSKISKLREKLYDPSARFQIRTRRNLSEKKYDLDDDWEEEKEEKEDYISTINKNRFRISIFAKIAIVAFIFFIVSLGYAFYVFYGGSKIITTGNVEITVIGPVSVGGGEELNLDIIIENKGKESIRTVDLVVEYPEGTKSFSDLKTDLPRIRDGIGDIPPNSIVKKSYEAALFGEEGDQKTINVSAEYRVPGSTAIFEKKKIFEVALKSSPIRLVVDTVKEITAGQEINFDVTLTSNSVNTLRDVLVTVDYPFGFTLSDPGIEPISGNNKWYFEKLGPKEEHNFVVSGILEGQDLEERVFKWKAGIADEVKKDELGINFTNAPKSITIIEPFLGLDLTFDGSLENNLVREGASPIVGHLTYKNNTGGAVQDVEIKLKLNGEVLSDESVEVEEGFFNSSDNTILWNNTTSDKFEKIASGETGALTFQFKTKILATRAAVYKNPEIVVDAIVTGKRLSESGVPEVVNSTSAKKIKIASDIELTAMTSYEGEPFANTGPIPPEVGQETTYTITLDLTNSSNLIKNGRLTATLPEYVRWNNKFTPSNERIYFDAVTRQIEWNLEDVKEHAGFIDPSRTISFQVTLTPSASQIGNTPTLLVNPTFTGLDTFTNTNVSATAENPNTNFGKSSQARELEKAQVVNKES
jgi:hypothetical protein